jgi:hypothetical protein
MNDKQLSIELKTRPDLCQGCQQPYPIDQLTLLEVMVWDISKRDLRRLRIMLCLVCLADQYEAPREGHHRCHNEPG